jgi:hypothetical protein
MIRSEMQVMETSVSEAATLCTHDANGQGQNQGQFNPKM